MRRWWCKGEDVPGRGKSHINPFVFCFNSEVKIMVHCHSPRSYPILMDYKENRKKKIFKNLSQGYLIGLHLHLLHSRGLSFNALSTVIGGNIWPLQKPLLISASDASAFSKHIFKVASYLHWNFSIDPASVNEFQTSHFFLCIDDFSRFLVGVTFNSSRSSLYSC